jgi:hypothetical protein
VRSDGTLTYTAASGAQSSRHIEIAPRQTVVIDDVATYVGRNISEDASIVYTPDKGAVSITARIASSGDAANGTTGTAVPVTARAYGLRNGSSYQFGGLEAAEPSAIAAKTAGATRTGLALVETSGESVTVRATLSFSGSQDLAAAFYSRDISLPAGGSIFYPDVTTAILGNGRAAKFGAMHALHLRIQVIDGNGSVIPIVEAVDSGSGDSYLLTP